MAIVLPDGILGNPGKDVEAVRRWLVRGVDGREIIFEEEDRVRWEDETGIHEERQMRKVTRIADDLPWIAKQYRRHLQGLPFEKE